MDEQKNVVTAKGLNPGMIVLLVIGGLVLAFLVGNYLLYMHAQKTLGPKKKKPVSKKKMKRERLKQETSLSPVLAGSDLHLVSNNGWTLLLGSSLSSSLHFSPFELPKSSLSDSTGSAFPQSGEENLQASDEDLYGADLHRVKSKAFLGGEDEDPRKGVLFSWTKASIFTPFSSLPLLSSVSTGAGEPAAWTPRQDPNPKNRPHWRNKEGIDSEAPADLVDFLTRTWPMQVTLGEDGSWVISTPAAVFFLRMNKEERERDLPLLLLPPLLLRNLINGGGNFWALLGLETGFAEPFIIFITSQLTLTVYI
nr:DNA-binding protein S1FA-like [Ipomoea batatas]